MADSNHAHDSTELDSTHEGSPPSGSPLQAGTSGLSPTPELMREFFGDVYDNLDLVIPQTEEPDLESLSTLESDPTYLPTQEDKAPSPTFSEIMRDPIFLHSPEQRNPSPTFSEIMRTPVYFPLTEELDLSPTLSEIMGDIILTDAPTSVYPEPPSLSTDLAIPHSTDIPWLPEDDFNTMLQLEPKRIMVSRSTVLQMNLPPRRLPNIPAAMPSFLLYGSTGRYSPPSPKEVRSRSNSFDPETNALSASDSEVEDPDQTEEPGPRETSLSTRVTRQVRSTEARPSTAGSISRDSSKRNPAKSWVRDHAVKGLSYRTALIVNYKPEDYYNALVRTPASWDVFNYTPHGELQANRFYTVQEIEEYLFSPHHRGLILWIQKNPADSARRYPTKTSSRCRFKECFAIKNCINQGQHRVAFDEQTYKDADTDPQHNAGYVHLYCLEKHLDFPDICAQLDVRAEDRDLPDEPDGKNRMLMSTDRERIAAKQFIKRCKRSGPPPNYPSHQMRNRPHEGTLTHLLAVTKMESENGKSQTYRAARGLKGSIISEHLGNLEIYAVERDKSRRLVNQNRRGPGPITRKRAREEEEEESEGEFIVVASAKNKKRTRRSRRLMSSSDEED